MKQTAVYVLQPTTNLRADLRPSLRQIDRLLFGLCSWVCSEICEESFPKPQVRVRAEQL